MKDVTPKPETRREATAEAVIRFPAGREAELRRLLETGGTEKGDALGVARTAGVMGGKRTPELLPFCHPLPLTHLEVAHEFLEEGGVRLEATARCIGPTGVEMEALTAASVAALALYDMLKPHASEVEIDGIRLLRKRGGRSDFRIDLDPPAEAAVVVMSDGVAAGEREDRTGRTIRAALEETDGVVPGPHRVLPDDPEALRETVREWMEAGVDLILAAGGTGLSERDRTVEGLEPLLDREAPGIMEAARAYGQRRMPYAMLSRGVAGMAGDTLVLTLPGSPSGARESFAALFPAVLHVFEVRRRGAAAHDG